MRLIQPLLLTSTLILSSVAWAEGGADRASQRIQQLRDKAQISLLAAERAPQGQRHLQMAQHMQMLAELMETLHADHPAPTLSAEQHLAWMEEHDKVMGNVLAQMQREHQLMISECKK